MIAQRAGKIINISSPVGVVTIDGQALAEATPGELSTSIRSDGGQLSLDLLEGKSLRAVDGHANTLQLQIMGI
jgi:hypothetical protein